MSPTLDMGFFCHQMRESQRPVKHHRPQRSQRGNGSATLGSRLLLDSYHHHNVSLSHTLHFGHFSFTLGTYPMGWCCLPVPQLGFRAQPFLRGSSQQMGSACKDGASSWEMAQSLSDGASGGQGGSKFLTSTQDIIHTSMLGRHLPWH